MPHWPLRYSKPGCRTSSLVGRPSGAGATVCVGAPSLLIERGGAPPSTRARDPAPLCCAKDGAHACSRRKLVLRMRMAMGSRSRRLRRTFGSPARRQRHALFAVNGLLLPRIATRLAARISITTAREAPFAPLTGAWSLIQPKNALAHAPLIKPPPRTEPVRFRHALGGHPSPPEETDNSARPAWRSCRRAQGYADRMPSPRRTRMSAATVRPDRLAQIAPLAEPSQRSPPSYRQTHPALGPVSARLSVIHNAMSRARSVQSRERPAVFFAVVAEAARRLFVAHASRSDGEGRSVKHDAWSQVILL